MQQDIALLAELYDLSPETLVELTNEMSRVSKADNVEIDQAAEIVMDRCNQFFKIMLPKVNTLGKQVSDLLETRR